MTTSKTRPRRVRRFKPFRTSAHAQLAMVIRDETGCEPNIGRFVIVYAGWVIHEKWGLLVRVSTLTDRDWTWLTDPGEEVRQGKPDFNLYLPVDCLMPLGEVIEAPAPETGTEGQP